VGAVVAAVLLVLVGCVLYPLETAHAAPTGASAESSAADGGYSLVTSNGGMYSFGTYRSAKSASLLRLSSSVAGIASLPNGLGYWIVTSDGEVLAFGEARFFGSGVSLHLGSGVVGIVSTPNGQGYWLVTSDGGVFAFGNAVFHGSAAHMHLAHPVVGMATNPGGWGYWLVTSDGGVLPFGNAKLHASTSPLRLTQPVVGITVTPGGGGYWLVGSDGGVYAFGDAKFYGSADGSESTHRSIGLVPSPGGTGYWVASSGGQVLAFGSAKSFGSLSTAAVTSPVVGFADRAVTAPPTPAVADQAIRVSGNKLINSSGHTVHLAGVDADGTESACIENQGFSWGPMNSSEALSIASWHATVVRVPLNEDCWLGINKANPSYSGTNYQEAIEEWVSDLNAAGLTAILDLHWSAPGTIKAVGQWPMPDEDHSVLFWDEVAKAFKSDHDVIFDLFNEPHLGGQIPTVADWSCWRNGCAASTVHCFDGLKDCRRVSYEVAGTQQLVNAIRSRGATQPIMIGGLNWAGPPCDVFTSGGDSSCAWLHYEPVDLDHQLIVSFHNYKKRSSRGERSCTAKSCWELNLLPVAADVPVVTGELGEKDCADAYVDSYMAWANAHDISYLAWEWAPSAKGERCTTENLRLLSGWAGSTNRENPVAIKFKADLSSVYSKRT